MHAFYSTSQNLCDTLCKSEANGNSKHLLILVLHTFVSKEVISFPIAFLHKKSIKIMITLNIFLW